jgi:hypothetical protein
MLVHTEHPSSGTTKHINYLVTKELIQEKLVIIQVRTVIAQFAFRNSYVLGAYNVELSSFTIYIPNG